MIGVAWRFLLTYAVAVLLWTGVLEAPYNECLAWVSRQVLSRTERPQLTTGITREGTRLIAAHVPHFVHVPAHEIETRRVHSNTTLFSALTLATPGVGWQSRALWLAGGGLLLSATHTAHVISSIHWRYALHNVGPYFTQVQVEQLYQMRPSELWRNPPALKRRLALGVEAVFNIVLQRIVPCLLWLPLFLGTRQRRFVRTPTPLGRARHRRHFGLAAVGGGMLVAGILALSTAPRTIPPNEIEGISLGMGVIAAKETLVARGYDWAESPRGVRMEKGLWAGFTDVWPNPFWSGRNARFNWIGLRVTQPSESPTLFSGCITRIETTPGEARWERYRLEADDEKAVCEKHWRSLSVGG